MSANERPERDGKAIELAEEPDFSLGNLRVRPSSRDLVAGDKIETVEPRVMQVLVALARRPGEVVSRDQLVELCWAGRVVTEDALNRSIAKARRFAGDATFSLETIPRVGYRLTPMEAPSPQPLPTPTPPVRSEESAPQRRSRLGRLGLTLLAIVGIAIVGGGAYGAWQYSQLNRPYFAVLAFDVVGGEANQLSDSIPHAIARQLTAQGFKVISPAISLRYRGERKSLAAAELEPRYIVDGSVRVEDDGSLFITTRIDSTLEPVSVWAQEFDVPDEASRDAPERVAAALSNLFNPGVNALFANSPEVTAGIMQIGSRWRAADDLGAYVAAQQLLRKEPASLSARIYWTMAVAFAMDLLPDGERAAVVARAREVARQASREAWAGAPMALYLLKPPVEWVGREDLLRRGLKSDYSDSSGLRRLLATQLANGGRLDEALSIQTQALSVDRLSLINNSTRIGILDTMGRNDQAEADLAKISRLLPGNEYLERQRLSLALARGDAEAIEALLRDPHVGPLVDPTAERRPLAAIARALRTRDAADVAQVEHECADPDKLARDRTSLCLRALVVLGRVDTFFELAARYLPEQRGATPEERDERWFADPRALAAGRVLFRKDMQVVRNDVRFIPIVERLGLLDSWRASGRWPDFCESEPGSVCARMRTRGPE